MITLEEETARERAFVAVSRPVAGETAPTGKLPSVRPGRRSFS